MKSRPAPLLVEAQPHRRYNPLTGEWVLISPQRTQRPWQGKIEATASEERPSYDPACYLCPGNIRANGESNPQYQGVYVFENDFSALTPDVQPAASAHQPLLREESVHGVCRVLCFSSRHDLTLALMTVEDILQVVDLWAQQIKELGGRYRWIQIFENKGEIMGCSNAHPHGQLWAGSALPNEPSKEDQHQRLYRDEFGANLLLDYLDLEGSLKLRLVVENDHWIALIPYWAIWPFETILIPRRHVLRLPDLEGSERLALARMLKCLLTRYDNLFNVSFPYTMGWHGAPHTSEDVSHWQLHAHFYPPLLRSAAVKKFMVGYEMLAEPQRDITPEAAAERLQLLSEVHYTLHSKGSKP